MNITQEEITKIFELFYSDLQYRMDFESNGEILYEKIQVLVGDKPSEEEIKSHLAAATLAVTADKNKRAKISAFQTKYPLQDQIVALIKASATGDRTEIVAMHAYWNSI